MSVLALGNQILPYLPHAILLVNLADARKDLNNPKEVFKREYKDIGLASQSALKTIQSIIKPNLLDKYKIKASISYLQLGEGRQFKPHIVTKPDQTELERELQKIEGKLEQLDVSYGCYGFTIGVFGKACISVPKQVAFKHKAIREIGFSLKHELGHLNYNHSLKRYVNSVLCAAASIFIFPLWLSPITNLVMMFVYREIFSFILKSYGERQADDFAIKEATYCELKGGVNLFRRVSIMNKILLPFDKFMTRWLKNKEGELIYGVHPSNVSRIGKIQKEITRRDEEFQKLPWLKRYFPDSETRSYFGRYTW